MAKASPQKPPGKAPASGANASCKAAGARSQATSVAEEGPAKKVPRTAASGANSAASGANLSSSPSAAAAQTNQGDDETDLVVVGHVDSATRSNEPIKLGEQLEAAAQAPIAATPGPMLVSELLKTGFSQLHDKAAFLQWAADTKAYVDVELLKFLQERKSQMSFPVPSNLLLLAALEITAAASCGNLTSFREVMNFENLMLSFSQSSVYEGAGTVFMLDFLSEQDMDPIRPAQLESALYLFSQEVFLLSSNHPPSRRYSFHVPIPAKVMDVKVAQKKQEGSTAVVMAHPLPAMGGRAVVIAWYGKMAEALKLKDWDLVYRLFEAAMSVPITMRVCPDADSCNLAGLLFSESLFSASGAAGTGAFWAWARKARRMEKIGKALSDNAPVSQMKALMKTLGLTYKNKAVTDAHVKALKALGPYLGDEHCNQAYDRTESMCPEIMEPTILMRIAQLSSARPHPKDALIFIFACMRIGRITGSVPAGGYTLDAVTGQEKHKVAWVHQWFKKQDLGEFILHETGLISSESLLEIEIFRTPSSIAQHFSASGELGLVIAHKAGDPCAAEGFENMFAMKVATYRDAADRGGKAQAGVDFMWALWCDVFEEELKELVTHDLQNNGSPGFLWHKYLNESSKEIGIKYRAFLEACAAGPISTPASGGQHTVLGASELDEDDLVELAKSQEMLMAARRKQVTFVPLPSVNGTSGAEYTKLQLEKFWEQARLGHKFQRKKNDLRAFFLSAELFPPNVAMHGAQANLNDPQQVDKERFKKCIEFIASRRGKDDVVILCDGRGRESRKVIESFEEKLTASGVHAYVESWVVYRQPNKKEDPRVPPKQACFRNNNREVIVVSLAKASNKGTVLVERSEFNSCGEASTAATTYTNVHMRKYRELPRMDLETKAACVGVAASGAVGLSRVDSDIAQNGHPFSQTEVKPLALLQRVCEHYRVTHIVDLAAGSGALAIAVAGTYEYEGIAANQAHREWLDSTLDRCIMYLAGKDKQLAKRLGCDDEFLTKVGKYFGSGTMMDARRLVEPTIDDEQEESSSDDDDEEEGEEEGGGGED